MNPTDWTFLQHTDVPLNVDIAEGSCSVYTQSSPLSANQNEDALLVSQFEGTYGLIAVADGVGGGRAGGQASELTLKTIATEVAHSQDSEESFRSCIINGIEKANQAVLKLGIGAATTVAILELHPGTYRSYHVGDSFVQVFGQRGKEKYLTIDHTPVGYAREAGMVSEQDAYEHPDRHVLTNVVGSQEMRIEIGPIRSMDPKDTIIVATDGLSDNLTGQEISRHICQGKLPDCARQLATRCKKRMLSDERISKPDDLTFAIYRQGK